MLMGSQALASPTYCWLSFGKLSDHLTGNLPSPKEKFVGLSSVDQRFGWTYLTHASPTLESLDNLVSPATQRMVFAFEFADPQFKQKAGTVTYATKMGPTVKAVGRLAKLAPTSVTYDPVATHRDDNTLSQVTTEPNGTQRVRGFNPEKVSQFRSVAREAGFLNDYLKRKGLNPSEAESLALEQMETRYRLAYEFIDAVTGKTASKEQYINDLSRWQEKAIEELMQNPSTHELFSSKTQEALKGLHEKGNFESNDGYSKLLSLDTKPEDFQPEFLEALEGSENVPQAMEKASKYLDKSLAKLPVGIAVKLKQGDETGRVRFGDNYYYGNWGNVRVIPKKVHDRIPFLTLEAGIRLTNRDKKNIAIDLDRTHKADDFLFDLKRQCERHYSTCNSFSTLLFWENGIPVLTTYAGTPSFGTMNLGVQHALGNPRIQDFTATHVNPKTMLVAVRPLIQHDLLNGLYEGGAYTGAGLVAWVALDMGIELLFGGEEDEESESANEETASSAIQE